MGHLKALVKPRRRPSKPADLRRSGVEISLELVGVLAVAGGSVRQRTTLTPGLGGVLVLGRPELAGGGSRLLQRLLFLCVGIANLDQKILVTGLDWSVVEILDHLLTVFLGLEAVGHCQ